VSDRSVTIVEVGPRDGLQNEPGVVPTEAKVRYAAALARAGIERIEATAFVHPKWVPQMADAEAVVAGLAADSGTGRARFSALVPNRRGLERALAAGVREVAVVVSATESFNRANLNAATDATHAEIAAVVGAAAAAGVRARAYLSVAFVCPYEGTVEPSRAAAAARRLHDAGVFEVALSDTIGAAAPRGVAQLLDAVAPHIPIERIALHLHDTRGTALPNVLRALDRGVGVFDASAGGIGGCPYAPGAAGNLATEDLLFLLDGMGIATGVSLEGVLAASRGLEAALGRALPARVLRAGGAPRLDTPRPA
jgi:hydroxymethylglutaryl-CoA lyase